MHGRVRWGLALVGFVLFLGLLVGSLAYRAHLGAEEDKGSFAQVKVQIVPEPVGVDGHQVITVKLAIAEGWHIYANPVDNEQMTNNQTELTFAARTQLPSVRITYPAGKTKTDSFAGDYKVYEGEVAIRALVQRDPNEAGPLRLTLRLQACNEAQMLCLTPSERTWTVP